MRNGLDQIEFILTARKAHDTFDLFADFLVQIHPDSAVLRIAVGQTEVLALAQDQVVAGRSEHIAAGRFGLCGGGWKERMAI